MASTPEYAVILHLPRNYASRSARPAVYCASKLTGAAIVPLDAGCLIAILPHIQVTYSTMLRRVTAAAAIYAVLLALAAPALASSVDLSAAVPILSINSNAEVPTTRYVIRVETVVANMLFGVRAWVNNALAPLAPLLSAPGTVASPAVPAAAAPSSDAAAPRPTRHTAHHDDESSLHGRRMLQTPDASSQPCVDAFGHVRPTSDCSPAAMKTAPPATRLCEIMGNC